MASGSGYTHKAGSSLCPSEEKLHKLHASTGSKVWKEKKRKIFKAGKDPKEMLRELWKFPIVRTEKIHKIPDKKNSKKAQEYRKEANRCFLQKMPKEAFYYFSQSTIFAENSTAPGSNLGFVYANRANLLMEIGAFDQALKDLERSVKHGYPQDKMDLLEKKRIALQEKHTQSLVQKLEGEIAVQQAAAPGAHEAGEASTSGLGAMALPRSSVPPGFGKDKDIAGPSQPAKEASLGAPEVGESLLELEVESTVALEVSSLVKELKEGVKGDSSSSEESQLSKIMPEEKKSLENIGLGTIVDSLPSDSTLQHVLPPCCKQEMAKVFKERGEGASDDDDDVEVDYINEVNRCTIFTQELTRIPDLPSSNPRAPSLSQSVDIGYTEEKGRGIFATKDILPGDILSKEVAYAFTPHGVTNRAICTHCGILTVVQIPCPFCTVVIYCGEACKEAAAYYHQYECEIGLSLFEEDTTGRLRNILRTLFRNPFSEVKAKFEKCQKETKEKPRSQQGFNEQGVYVEDDLIAVFHAAASVYALSPAELIENSFFSLLLMQFIAEETTYMGEKRKISEDQALEGDLLDLATILFKIYLTLINGRALHTKMYSSQTRDFTLLDAGSAFYPLHTLYNHSCDPDVIIYYYGRTAIARAQKCIRAGQELYVHYGYYFENSSREDRRYKLYKLYNFNCNCRACDENWQCPPQSMHIAIVTCPFCKEAISKEEGCTNCNMPTFEIPRELDYIHHQTTVTPSKIYELLEAGPKMYFRNAILSDSFLDVFRLVVGIYSFFVEEPCWCKMKLQELLQFNYTLRAYHMHENLG